MGHDKFRMLRYGMPPDWDTGMRLVALIIADAVYDTEDTGFIPLDELEFETGLTAGGISSALKRLARAGYDMRVTITTGKDGRPVYTVRGRSPDYRVPVLPPHPEHPRTQREQAKGGSPAGLTRAAHQPALAKGGSPDPEGRLMRPLRSAHQPAPPPTPHPHLPLPPQPPAPLWPAAVPDGPNPGEGDHGQTPSPSQAEVLAADILRVRPEWRVSAIKAALTDPRTMERPWPIIERAALIVARDRSTTTPGRLPENGPWWAQAAAELARDGHTTKPPWCGQCDELSRLLGMDGDEPRHCPDCHPPTNIPGAGMPAPPARPAGRSGRDPRPGAGAAAGLRLAQRVRRAE